MKALSTKPAKKPTSSRFAVSPYVITMNGAYGNGLARAKAFAKSASATEASRARSRVQERGVQERGGRMPCAGSALAAAAHGGRPGCGTAALA